MLSWRNPQDKMMHEQWGERGPKDRSPRATYEFFGLSTDTKPAWSGPYGYLPNGAIFYEMDTSKIYLYDAYGSKWYEQKPGQGGDPS